MPTVNTQGTTCIRKKTTIHSNTALSYNLSRFLTSYFSFNASPRRLKEIAVIAINMPGNTTIHGAELINTLLELIMAPQVAVGG